MNRQELTEYISTFYDNGLETIKKKNHDYSGGKDSTDAFVNFKNALVVGVSVERGILVRMIDKISRISSLIDTDAHIKDEALADTLLDLSNYSALLAAYIESKKGKNND